MYHPGMLNELGTDHHTPMKANTVPNDNHLGVLLLLWSKCPYLGIVDNDLTGYWKAVSCSSFYQNKNIIHHWCHSLQYENKVQV